MLTPLLSIKERHGENGHALTVACLLLLIHAIPHTLGLMVHAHFPKGCERMHWPMKCAQFATWYAGEGRS